MTLDRSRGHPEACYTKQCGMFQDHDGDGRAAAAGLPLHRAQPHREGAHPLSGAARPGPAPAPPAPPAALRDSGPDILLQVNTDLQIEVEQLSVESLLNVCLHLLRVYKYFRYSYIYSPLYLINRSRLSQ